MVTAASRWRRGVEPAAQCWRKAALLVIVACASVSISCLTTGPGVTLTTRPVAFPTSTLEQQLHRGASTKTDVRQLLGSPDGTGSLLFPAQNEIREIWFYERLQVTEKSGALEIEQDVLLMFFHGDVYDGFMWFSDADRPDSGAGAGP